jgi:hypothetical protein
MILQNIFLKASTIDLASSLIAPSFGDYQKVQLGATHREITMEFFANQSGMIEPQSYQIRNLL